MPTTIIRQLRIAASVFFFLCQWSIFIFSNTSGFVENFCECDAVGRQLVKVDIKYYLVDGVLVKECYKLVDEDRCHGKVVLSAGDKP